MLGNRDNHPLFTPEFILPSQFFTQSYPVRTPETRLMLAVLLQVWKDYTLPQHAPGRRSNRLSAEAITYIMSTDVTWPFSFEPICNSLGIDPGWLRRGLLQSEAAIDVRLYERRTVELAGRWPQRRLQHAGTLPSA